MQPTQVKRFSRRGCLKSIAFLLSAAIVIVFLLAAGVIYGQVWLVTTPFRDPQLGSIPSLSYQDISLTTADGLTISGWYVPGRRPEAIVLVHGIHANRSFLIPQAIFLAKAGYHLVLIDLRGHGRSEGSALSYGYREALDVQAAVDYLTALPGIKKVGALGHSLGAAAVVRAAAADKRLQALVVQSSYSSLPQAVEETFNNYAILPKRPFGPLIIALSEYRLGMDISQVDSARDLASMPSRPVLIIHSAGDTLFQPHHAQILYDSARGPKTLLLVEGVGHANPIFGNEAGYIASILDFFGKAF